MWTDLTVEGNDLTADAEGSAPVYKVNQINGRPGLRFNNTHWLRNNNIDSYFTGEDKPVSFFIVTNIIASSNSGFLGAGNLGNTTQRFWPLWVN